MCQHSEQPMPDQLGPASPGRDSGPVAFLGVAVRDPSLFVPSHVAIWHHRKFRRLVTTLAIEPVAALGHLHAFWHAVMLQCPDGVLRGWDDQDVADAAQWRGEPCKMAEALRNAGWVDGLPGAEMSVHDWAEYGGHGTTKRAMEAKRKRDERGRESKDKPDASKDVRGHVPIVTHETETDKEKDKETDPEGMQGEGRTEASAPAAEVKKPTRRKKTHATLDDVLRDTHNESGKRYADYFVGKYPTLHARGRLRFELEAAWDHMSRGKRTDMPAYLQKWLNREEDQAKIQALRAAPRGQPGEHVAVESPLDRERRLNKESYARRAAYLKQIEETENAKRTATIDDTRP